MIYRVPGGAGRTGTRWSGGHWACGRCDHNSTPRDAIMNFHKILWRWIEAPRADKAAVGAINDSVGKFDFRKDDLFCSSTEGGCHSPPRREKGFVCCIFPHFLNFPTESLIRSFALVLLVWFQGLLSALVVSMSRLKAVWFVHGQSPLFV
jgi:hypothetical protein